MDPDGRVEQNVVTQLLEEHDAILQIAQVSGKGQHDVQDGPRHVHLGGLRRRQGDSAATKEGHIITKRTRLGTEEHLLCLTSPRASCDLSS